MVSAEKTTAFVICMNIPKKMKRDVMNEHTVSMENEGDTMTSGLEI